jgi:acyl-CoA reductase-like NAD-dependent aldehyde dehydrogenase
MAPRLDVRKTYKLYIGGQFPRSESGRTFAVRGPDGTLLAHAAKASRKDLRDAVGAARGAQAGWSGRTAYNRAQILYRIGEIIEGRAGQFVAELTAAGATAAAARREVAATIDRWVWYAGWADKFTQVLGAANPVAGPYFNFSVLEPCGVVGVVAPDDAPLLALVSRLAPALTAGNTAVAVVSERSPLVAITLAEALATSDVPGGVVNLLTGSRAELVPWLADHADVNAVDLTGCDDTLAASAAAAAAATVTRVVRATATERRWLTAAAQHPYLIEQVCEVKTVWHPVGR